MKARIEKKLSKRLVEIAPTLFKGAWVDNEVMDSADRTRTSVSHCWRVGGELDYWGEATDAFSAWDWWLSNCYWISSRFPIYPKGHRFEGLPNTEGFKFSASNLLALAQQYELTKQPERDRL